MKRIRLVRVRNAAFVLIAVLCALWFYSWSPVTLASPSDAPLGIWLPMTGQQWLKSITTSDVNQTPSYLLHREYERYDDFNPNAILIWKTHNMSRHFTSIDSGHLTNPILVAKKFSDDMLTETDSSFVQINSALVPWDDRGGDYSFPNIIAGYQSMYKVSGSNYNAISSGSLDTAETFFQSIVESIRPSHLTSPKAFGYFIGGEFFAKNDWEYHSNGVSLCSLAIK